MDDQRRSEGLRQYGELFYRADAVAAILRAVADTLEGDRRIAVLRLSSNIPSTMSWPNNGGDVQQQASLNSVYSFVQFRIQHTYSLDTDPIRLDALLWRGPGLLPPADGQHDSGLADGK
jgi:hypothetical protein